MSKAALLQPSNVLTLNELGESYAKNGEFEMAANCFKNANTKVRERDTYERSISMKDSLGKKSFSFTKSFDHHSTIGFKSH